MQIAECCNRAVAIANKDTTIVEAAQRMRQLHVGSLVVIEEDGDEVHPIGIVTDRDLVVEVLAEQVPMAEVTVGDVMSDEVLIAREEDDLFDTLDKMYLRGVRRIPVVDADDDLAGVLSIDDVAKVLATATAKVSELIAREQTIELSKRL